MTATNDNEDGRELLFTESPGYEPVEDRMETISILHCCLADLTAQRPEIAGSDPITKVMELLYELQAEYSEYLRMCAEEPY